MAEIQIICPRCFSRQIRKIKSRKGNAYLCECSRTFTRKDCEKHQEELVRKARRKAELIIQYAGVTKEQQLELAAINRKSQAVMPEEKRRRKEKRNG